MDMRETSKLGSRIFFFGDTCFKVLKTAVKWTARERKKKIEFSIKEMLICKIRNL